MFAGPGFGEWGALDGFEVVAREEGDEIIHALPPEACVMVRGRCLGFAVDGFDDQYAVGLQDARYFTHQLFGVE